MSWFQGRSNSEHVREVVRAPLARTEGLVVEDVGDEVLVYDASSTEAHCLGQLAATVWHACDGRTTVAEMQSALGLDVESIRYALEELDRCALLEGPGRAPGITRREATAKMIKAGAAAAAVPLIYSQIAPAAAMANSEKVCQNLTATSCSQCTEFGCCCCTGYKSSNSKTQYGNKVACVSSCSQCPKDGSSYGFSGGGNCMTNCTC